MTSLMRLTSTIIACATFAIVVIVAIAGQTYLNADLVNAAVQPKEADVLPPPVLVNGTVDGSVDGGSPEDTGSLDVLPPQPDGSCTSSMVIVDVSVGASKSCPRSDQDLEVVPVPGEHVLIVKCSCKRRLP